MSPAADSADPDGARPDGARHDGSGHDGIGPGAEGRAGARRSERLRAVADELYALRAADFLAARAARVRTLRDEGDRPFAGAVGRLGRPTAAAALVNALGRSTGSFDELVALGIELRAAQDEGDAALLRTLAADRRRLVAELVQRAAVLGGERAPGQSVLADVERTLTAAVLDQGVAAAVRSGRLVRGLSADGLSPADLAGAVAADDAADGGMVDEDRPASSAGSGADPRAAARAAERRGAEERAARADRQSDDARRALARAESAVGDAERAAADRLADADDLRGRLADLRRRLGTAESAADTAEEQLDAALAAMRTARRAADRAQAVAEDAGASVDRLR